VKRFLYLGSTPIIFMAASGNVDQAVRLLKAGAADYLKKTRDISPLIARLQQVIGEQAASKKSIWPAPAMISAGMVDLKSRLERLAATNASALIVGAAGSGKEVVARYTHRLSARAGEPFVVLRCGRLVGQDGDRLLFGEMTRSAANGAEQLQIGALEQVGRGTLFLDEIGELQVPMQVRLAQVIDSRQFTRLGGSATAMPFEARILAASHFSAEALCARLAPDLLNRIAVIEITVPPLRNRQADIEPLVEALLPGVASELGVAALPVEAEAISAMRDYHWLGNVRELRNRLVRALSFAEGSKIGVADIFPSGPVEEAKVSVQLTLDSTRAEAERRRIVEALAQHQGRVGRAAHSLGISRVTLWTKMKRLQLSHDAISTDEKTLVGIAERGSYRHIPARSKGSVS
jgi:two-component system, NtrC family, response regulator AtoC